LSIAALLGEKIYNFGELLLHPILDQLKTPEGTWLRELLFAMNSGDLDAFGKLLPQLPSNVVLFLGITDSSLFLLRMRQCCNRRSIWRRYCRLFSHVRHIVELFHSNLLRRKHVFLSLRLSIL
jgi:hypothetical protein